MINWKDEYSVNVKEIDTQHKELVKIISSLFNAINKMEVDKEIPKILSDLEKFAKTHFETEERYFKKFNYSDAENHIKEHENFKKKITDIKTKLTQNKTYVSYELVDFLEDWLLEHLMEMDQQYVECFNENGLK